MQRLWRDTDTLAKVQRGPIEKKDVNYYVQSPNVYENKQNSDKMPAEKSGITAQPEGFLQKEATL